VKPPYRSKEEAFVDLLTTSIDESRQAEEEIERQEYEKASQSLDRAQEAIQRLGEEIPKIREALLRCSDSARSAKEAIERKRPDEARAAAEDTKVCAFEILVNYIELGE